MARLVNIASLALHADPLLFLDLSERSIDTTKDTPGAVEISCTTVNQEARRLVKREAHTVEARIAGDEEREEIAAQGEEQQK